jgi:hypothetical protein
MKNAKFYSIISALLIAAVIFVSCKDDFTEEDALNAQQTITYNVIVQNASSKAGLEGVTVSIIQKGETMEATTNAQGIAIFEDIKIGSSIPVTVSKDGFGSVSTVTATSDVNYRQGEVSSSFNLLSLTENIATVKGKVEIESDLTNTLRETVATGKVTATLEQGNYNGVYIYSGIVVEATVAADGTYELKLPTFGTGVEYTITTNDLETDQKIAYNNKAGESGFPLTLPKVETIKTVFSNGAYPAPIPSVPAVYATVSGGSIPATLEVDTNLDGEISNILIYGEGAGYTDASAAPVTITSLLGGSGAIATANISGGKVVGVTITSSGLGYPTEGFTAVPDANNGITPSAASGLSTSNYAVRPNDIKVRNIFFGTGSSRAIDIQ